MKIIRLFLLLILTSQLTRSHAQIENYFHEGSFRKFSGLMCSNYYKPDLWEAPLFNKAIKTAFPVDLNKFPDKYKGKLIHLIGIVESVTTEQTKDSTIFTIALENRYWDYIEDYSIQDEVMFISPNGGGKFKLIVIATNTNSKDIETIKKFQKEKKLFLIYAYFNEIVDGIPILILPQIKFIDYKFYTSNVFSYDIERDSQGQVVTSSSGELNITNFTLLKVPGRGQNK